MGFEAATGFTATELRRPQASVAMETLKGKLEKKKGKSVKTALPPLRPSPRPHP
jgi:hypothetical protein